MRRPGWVLMATVALGLGASACMGEADRAPASAEAKVIEPAKAVQSPTAAEPTKPSEPVKSPQPPKPAEPEPPPAVVDPPAPALAVSLPAAKDPKAPAVVFAALVARDDGRWEVDMTDFAGLDVKTLERDRNDAMMRGQTEDEEDEATALGLLDPKSPLLPKGFAVGDPWTVITPSAAVHHTAMGFRATMDGGSGTLHFYVRLGETPKGAEGPALAFRGHLPTTTRLAVPTPKAPSAVGPKVLPNLVEKIEASYDDDMRELAPREPLTDADVELYPGRFPGGRTHAAFVMTKPDDEEQFPLSTFLFVKGDGQVEMVAAPEPLGTVELLGLLDVNGDGVDEVFFEDAYHEGWYLLMLQWDGETFALRTVTGDGI